jgi:hypothetical protein
MVCWIYFYNDNPSKSRFVDLIEAERINKDKSLAHINMSQNIPYLHILRDPLVWTIWANAFFEISTGIFNLMYQPSFLKYVLNYDVKNIGLLTVLGTLFHIPLKFIFGLSSDKIK